MSIGIESGSGSENGTEGQAFRVLYTHTPRSASRFDAYRFRLEGETLGARDGEREEARQVERAADAIPRQVLFRELVPGRLYNVTLQTVSHNVTSHPVQRQARLCQC